MADTLKKLYSGKPGTSSATLYTVPANTKTIVKSITLCNTATNVATVTLTAGGATVASVLSLDPGQTVILTDVGILEAGDLIAGLQGTTSAISIWISGMEVA